MTETELAIMAVAALQDNTYEGDEWYWFWRGWQQCLDSKIEDSEYYGFQFAGYTCCWEFLND